MTTRAPDSASSLRAVDTPEHRVTPAGSPRQVAMSLVDVEATLRALDRSCLAASAALLPPASIADDISARFRASAAAWEADGAAAPSRERQAEILACLHDAGATLRAAAECCRRARLLLQDTYRHPAAGMPGQIHAD